MPTALITGASSGIGAACARALAPDHHLVLVARDRERLRRLSAELPGEHRLVAADLATPDGIAAAAEAAGEGLDALINNAGAFALARGEAIGSAHLEAMWRINAAAPILLTAACLGRLRDGGCIVNISSVAAEAAFQGCGAYTAAKCALEGWSRCLREELRPRRIRVTVIAPGATDTPIWPADFASADRARMLDPAQVAAAVRMAVSLPPQAALDRVALSPSAGPI